MANTNHSQLSSCFQLLKQVLLDAFKIRVLFFSYPYENISKIDQGMRASVWTNYQDTNTKIHFTDTTQEYRMLIIKSNLGFYNILAIFGSDSKPDFFSLGPFRDEELSPNYFAQILKDSNIAPADMQQMKYMYEKMPLAPLDAVINVSKHIISNFFEAFQDILPEMMQYSEQKRTVDVNRDALANYSMEYSANYQQLLFSFLSCLKSGDSTAAKKALHDFLQQASLTGGKGMREYKHLLHTVNDHCQLTLLYTPISPVHVIRLGVSIRMKLESITTMNKLEQMNSEICHKYCLLIRNYANPDSSRLTKDVSTYIQLHMDEEIHLRFLAAHFQKNPSVLSKIFRRETGQTVTDYIQQTRIQEALRLFHTTTLSVSEVAMSVGYTDFSYFSKVFSKHVGLSPRQYKQMHSDT